MSISQSETYQYFGEMMVAALLVPLFRTNKFLIIFNQYIHTVKLSRSPCSHINTLHVYSTVMSLICSGFLETCASHWEYASTLKCHWPELRHMIGGGCYSFWGAQLKFIYGDSSRCAKHTKHAISRGAKLLKIRCQEIEFGGIFSGFSC